MKAIVDAIREADTIVIGTHAPMDGDGMGCGLALLRCVKPIEALIDGAEGDERTGLQILSRALSAPARQIAENSSVDGGVVVARMLEGEGGYGFDAARNVYVDLIEAGIVDPTKVVRVALQNAASVAGLMITTEAMIAPIPEDKPPNPSEYAGMM